MNRNRKILAVLLVVLAACVLYAYLETPRLEKAPPRETGYRVGSVTNSEGQKSGERVDGRIDFAYLEQEAQEFEGASRDIFNFGGQRVAVTRPPEVARPVEKPVVSVPVEAQPVPLDMVNRSLSQFTFVGFLEKAGVKTVFLSSSGSMFLVKSGERFGADQEFMVESIDGDLLRVKHAGREGTIELRLIEQQKLNSSVSAPAKLAPMPAGAAQARTRTFMPKKRVTRPITPQEGENSFPEINQENNPEEGQDFEPPEEGEGLEGEVNGTNQ